MLRSAYSGHRPQGLPWWRVTIARVRERTSGLEGGTGTRSFCSMEEGVSMRATPCCIGEIRRRGCGLFAGDARSSTITRVRARVGSRDGWALPKGGVVVRLV